MSLADWFRRHRWLVKTRPEVDPGDPDPYRGQAMAEQRYGLIGHEGLSKADDQPTADDIEIK